jgi:hypothetical protein
MPRVLSRFRGGLFVKRWLKILLVAIVVLVVAAVGAVKMFGPRAFLGPRSRSLTARRRAPGKGCDRQSDA